MTRKTNILLEHLVRKFGTDSWFFDDTTVCN